MEFVDNTDHASVVSLGSKFLLDDVCLSNLDPDRKCLSFQLVGEVLSSAE